MPLIKVLSKIITKSKTCPLKEFLDIYPIFQKYDADLFKSIDGFWEIPLDLKIELMEMLETDQLDYDDEQQINIYLEDR